MHQNSNFLLPNTPIKVIYVYNKHITCLLIHFSTSVMNCNIRKIYIKLLNKRGFIFLAHTIYEIKPSPPHNRHKFIKKTMDMIKTVRTSSSYLFVLLNCSACHYIQARFYILYKVAHVFVTSFTSCCLFNRYMFT